MRFATEHRFRAAPATVAGLMVDPAFAGTLELPDLSMPQVLEHTRNGRECLLSVRYEFTGQLDGLARRVIAGRKLTLVQVVRLDEAAGAGTYRLEAEADPRRVHGDATITITADGDGCVRRFDGEFVVGVPLMGGTIEKRLLPGILTRFDAEAAALSARIGEGDARG
jgi:hypothetical protein